MAEDFEPKILVFCCNWCSYAGADLAGVSRIQMPPDFRVLRVMCSGRVDPELAIRALLDGADGVLALGCHIGDCHYLSGNLDAREKFEALKSLLEQTKSSNGRFDYDWVSASEGQRFKEVVSDFIGRIKSLGPLRGDQDEVTNLELRALLREVSDFRTRWLVGKKRHILIEGDSYGEQVAPGEMDEVIEQILHDQLVRSIIIESVAEEPATVEELAEATQIDSIKIFRHIQRLRAKGMVDMVGTRGHYPLYKVAPGVID